MFFLLKVRKIQLTIMFEEAVIAVLYMLKVRPSDIMTPCSFTLYVRLLTLTVIPV